MGLVMLIASVLIMTRIANAEDRSPIIWGVVTVVLCIACEAGLGLPLISTAIGLALSFMSMFVMKVIQE